MSDSLLFKYAVNTGKMISMEFISKGDYYPEQAWGSEGQIYPSLMGTALLGLYKKTNNVLFLDGVKAIIESNIQKQMPSGGWALSLGATANGVKFKVSEYIKNCCLKEAKTSQTPVSRPQKGSLLSLAFLRQPFCIYSENF